MSSTILSAHELHTRLSDPSSAAQTVVIDCRFSLMQPEAGRQQYEQGHIPGAYYLDLNQDLSSPVSQHGGRHPLPDPNRLAETLSSLGITEQTLVVAYDDSRFAFAARLWWLLGYLGHDRRAVLEGGWSAWQAARYPTSTDIPPAKPGALVPQLRPDRVVDIETVRDRQGKTGVVLIDSREPARYRGEHEPIDPVAGHIPGAVNYPWQDVTTELGVMQPLAVQRDRWADLASAKEVIVYCGSGVTACVNLLSLDQVGITAKLYAGSWSDWCSYL